MKDELCYQVIIPEEWYMNFAKHQIFDEISEHMKRLRQEGKAFDGSHLEIAGIKTTLRINHLDLYWSFIREGDTIPNPIDYFYSGNLITEIFPHLLEEYRDHQKRRELEKEVENFVEISLIEKDDGIDMCDRKEYLVDTEQLLQYEMIVPKMWYNAPNFLEMIDKLHCRVDQVVEDGKDKQFAVIVLGGQEAILKICNEKLCWWISLPHHETPNTEEYVFTGDLLEKHFPELIEDNAEITAKSRYCQSGLCFETLVYQKLAYVK